MENNTITITNDKGEKVVLDILVSFDSEETGKSYVIYTDNSKDENGNTRVYASTYNPNDAKMELGDIETEEEWKIVETVIQTIQERLTSNGE